MAIEIKEPCGEDWSKMNPTEKGAFCKSCVKEVIDFTGMSPLEIKTHLAIETNRGNSVCGKIRNEQLTTINDAFFAWKNEQERFKVIWIFALLTVFGLTLFSCQNTLTREMVQRMEDNGTELLMRDSNALEESMLTEQAGAEHLDGVPLEDSTEKLELECPPVYISIEESSNETSVGLQCEFTLGFMTLPPELAGAISVPIEEEPELARFLQGYLPLLPEPIAPRIGIEPTTNQRNFTQFILAESESDDFEMAIHPLPIDETSRLLLKVNKPLELAISIECTEYGKVVFAASQYRSIGEHVVDAELAKLAVGNYLVSAKSTRHTREIHFSIFRS